MKIQSIQQHNQNFKGGALQYASSFVAKHPEFILALAGSSVISQKMVMSTAEAGCGPLMDIEIGRVITEATGEKDGRTNQSAKVQAIRSFSQTVGGTITGIAIRALCIGGVTAAFMKGGQKAGNILANLANPKGEQNLYKYTQSAEAWGKSAGGALATIVMLFTNFLLDVPIVNAMNKKVTELVDKAQKSKEVK